MADSGISLHCNADCQVDGARHGDLGQRENHTDQAEEARVREEAAKY